MCQMRAFSRFLRVEFLAGSREAEPEHSHHIPWYSQFAARSTFPVSLRALTTSSVLNPRANRLLTCSSSGCCEGFCRFKAACTGVASRPDRRQHGMKWGRAKALRFQGWACRIAIGLLRLGQYIQPASSFDEGWLLFPRYRDRPLRLHSTASRGSSIAHQPILHFELRPTHF